MSIITVLLTMTLTAFGGLRNTIRMNEYMLNLEQDIRLVQRAAMLLERNPLENWLYGVGIDFTKVTYDDSAGNYRVFKWCSPYPDHGHISTRSNIPGFVPPDFLSDDLDIDPEVNGNLPLPTDVSKEFDFPIGLCDSSMLFPGEIYLLSGYSKPMAPPVSNITFLGEARFVLFESVSGRAFLYNDNGELLNYDQEGNPSPSAIPDLTIQFRPVRGTGKTREITIMNLSGKIDTHMF